MKCCICTIEGDEPFGKKTGYHTFPKDPDLKQKWINALKGIGILIPTPTNYHRVCSHHFSEEDRIFNGKFNLRKGAVPSIFFRLMRQEKFRNNVTCKQQPTCEIVVSHPAAEPFVETSISNCVCSPGINVVLYSKPSPETTNEQIEDLMEELARLKKENAELRTQNTKEVRTLQDQLTRVKNKVKIQNIKLTAVRKQRDYFKLKCLRDRQKMVSRVKTLVNEISKSKNSDKQEKSLYEECWIDHSRAD